MIAPLLPAPVLPRFPVPNPGPPALRRPPLRTSSAPKSGAPGLGLRPNPQLSADSSSPLLHSPGPKGGTGVPGTRLARQTEVHDPAPRPCAHAHPFATSEERHLWGPPGAGVSGVERPSFADGVLYPPLDHALRVRTAPGRPAGHLWRRAHPQGPLRDHELPNKASARSRTTQVRGGVPPFLTGGPGVVPGERAPSASRRVSSFAVHDGSGPSLHALPPNRQPLSLWTRDSSTVNRTLDSSRLVILTVLPGRTDARTQPPVDAATRSGLHQRRPL